MTQWIALLVALNGKIGGLLQFLYSFAKTKFYPNKMFYNDETNKDSVTIFLQFICKCIRNKSIFKGVKFFFAIIKVNKNLLLLK